MSQDGKIKWNLKYEKSEPVIAATTPFLVINQVTYGLRYSRMDQVKFVEDSLRPCYFKFFKGRLAQILLGPFLNTLTHINRRILITLPNI